MTIKQVTMYTSSQCPHCHRQKSWMNQHQIPFEDKVVDQDEKARHEFLALNGQGVPYTIISFGNAEQVHITGFDEKRLSRILVNQNIEE